MPAVRVMNPADPGSSAGWRCRGLLPGSSGAVSAKIIAFMEVSHYSSKLLHVRP